MKYRLYVDESGDHGYGDLANIGGRYLAISGLMIESESYRTKFHPAFEQLKQDTIPHDPDDPIVLHRRDIIDKKGAFKALQDPSFHSKFNTELIGFIHDQSYRIITVVIDKKEHHDKYGKAAFHPYNYCLAVLMERYCGLLRYTGNSGDVLAESRGRKEDTELKNAFDNLLASGTQGHSANFFADVLTTNTLKTARKSANIAGLQLADIIVYPSKQDVLTEFGRIEQPQGEFRLKIRRAMRRKYNRQLYDGRIKGYGMILL